MRPLPFDQVSLGWQVWGYGMFFACLCVLIVLIIAQWPELKAFALELFTDPVRADDAFVCPRGRDEELASLTESSRFRQVVTK